MPKIDLDIIPQRNTTAIRRRSTRPSRAAGCAALAPATGLSGMGVSHVVLKPGAWSSQRHWHDGEDEFLVMLSGEAVLVEDEGETILRPGDCAAWPKGVRNGHHLINRSESDCAFCASAPATARRAAPIRTSTWCSRRLAISIATARLMRRAASPDGGARQAGSKRGITQSSRAASPYHEAMNGWARTASI